MNFLGRNELHRTAKVLLDTNEARDISDAYRILKKLVLQIEVGRGIAHDLAAQAALLTAVNTGSRAMLGGVHVVIDEDSELSLPWALGQNLSAAVHDFGGCVVDQLQADRAVLRIASPAASNIAKSQVQLNLLWHGWCGGVSDTVDEPLTSAAMPLAGVVAGALGVSEVFQHMCGAPMAGRRSVGLSLWRPDQNWRSPNAMGTALRYAPSRLWLLGLGHLGQANAWNLGCLPYQRPEELEVYLVDFDVIVEANRSTGLLTSQWDLERLKSRVVQQRLESLGHHTRLVERPFDDRTIPQASEPTLALAGFDKPEPRRALGDKFGRVVDAGLGDGPSGYLDMLIHSFPSQLTPAAAFPDPQLTGRQQPPVYEAEISQRIDQGAHPADARCGVVDLAGATAAASFVGAIAGALSAADILRLLHGGQHYASINLDLRSPNNVFAAPAQGANQQINPGFSLVRLDTQ